MLINLHKLGSVEHRPILQFSFSLIALVMLFKRDSSVTNLYLVPVTFKTLVKRNNLPS